MQENVISMEAKEDIKIITPDDNVCTHVFKNGCVLSKKWFSHGWTSQCGSYTL